MKQTYVQNGMIETAQSEINSQKERAIADINNQVSELSVLIASKVLRKEISEQDQKALVDKYLKEAGDKIMVKVANKYAKALFDVSLDTNNLETINEELTVINEAVKDKIEQLRMVDSNPTQTAEQRRELINGVFTDINPYIKNMMYVLADNRHISLIADVFKAFQSLYNGHYNQDFATIESDI